MQPLQQLTVVEERRMVARFDRLWNGAREPQTADSAEASRGQERLGWRVIDMACFRNPPDAVAAAVYALIFVLAAAIFGLFLYTAYKIFFSDPTADWQLVDARGKYLNVLLPALAALVGLPFIVWRLVISHRQVEIAREVHLTTLMSKALEQLSATEDQQRGPVNILGRIASDSTRDAWPIAGALAAFLRRICDEAELIAQPTAADVDDSTELRRARMRRLIRSTLRQLIDVVGCADVEVQERVDAGAISVGGQTLVSMKFDRFDFAEANFNQTEFHDSTFRRCLLTSANLSKAVVRPASRNGSGSSDHDWTETHLDGAVLAGAKLEELRWSKISAKGAVFDEASLHDCKADHCVFAQAHFRAANLSGASFPDCDFDCADLDGALLDDCDLAMARNLSLEQIQSAYGDAATKLPAGMHRPSNTNWLEGAATDDDRRRRDRRRQDYLALILNRSASSPESSQVPAAALDVLNGG